MRRPPLVVPIAMAAGSVLLGLASVVVYVTDTGTTSVSAPATTTAPTVSTTTTTTTTRAPTTTSTQPIEPGAPIEVAGVITVLSAEQADAPDIAAPFSVEVPDPGKGRGTIIEAVVDGKSGTIAWDGGRPLRLEGGTLVIGTGRVDVAAGRGVRWLLDDEPRRLSPGDWRTTSSVAFGSEGLAQPRDGLRFQAVAGTRLQTKGGAFVERPGVRTVITGSGSVHLEGKFTVGGTRRRVVDLAAIRYRFVIEPESGGYRVSGEIVEPSR